MDFLNLGDQGWLQKQGDIYILKMFMPFPLKENNCFLAESDNGWVVIDTGVNLEQNQAVFTAGLKAIGISFKQLSAVYLTHYHHDHTGMAGWLQQKSDLPVFLPQPDLLTWQRFIDTNSYLERAWDKCQLAGWPWEFAQELDANITQINAMLRPYPEFSPLFTDNPLNLGGQLYDVISIPGHTDGHLVFHNPASGFLLSGDNVVDHTILHLTDWPHTLLTNPCDMHLTALQELKDLNINMVLPGHGRFFTDLAAKIDLITTHHRNRKATVYNTLHAPMTAWELTASLFEAHNFIHIRRLVLAETLAYLESLVNKGLVEQDLVQGSYIYRPSDLKTASSKPVVAKHN